MLQKIKLANFNHSPLPIFLLWFISLIIVNPIGEFPLNDDWAYTLTVQEWLNTGVYRINDWPAMSLFAQICWGTLFAKVFGFSFTVLRFSTIVIAACGAYAFWVILRELNIAPPYRSLALAVLLFNPLFFYLSNTFMTDVPFLSTCLIASLFYLKFIQQQRLRWWALAVFFSICAILIRQLGLLIPLAFMGAIGLSFVFMRNDVKLRPRTLVLSVLSVLFTYASLKGYVYFLDQTTGIPAMFSQLDSITNRLGLSYIFSSTFKYSGIYLMYIGAFLLPILLTRFWIKNKQFYILFGVLLILIITLVQHIWNDFPLGNTIYDLGMGVVALSEGDEHISSFSLLLPWMILLIKSIALLGVILLMGHLTYTLLQLRLFIAKTSPSELVFKWGVLFFILAYSFFLIIDGNRFDRYLLPLVPFLMALLLPKKKTFNSKALIFPWILIAFMATYSIGSIYDYLSWNKARWKALSFIENQDVSPSKIDGGFEYNGWHQTSHRNPMQPYSKSWWFVDEDDYVVAFEPYHNYQVMAAFPFKRIFNTSIDTIYALQRPTWNQIDTISIDTVFNMKKEEAYAFNEIFYPIKPFEQFSVSIKIKGDENSFRFVNQTPDATDFYYAHTPFKVREDESGWKLITMEMKIPEDYPSDTLKLYLWKQQPKALQIDGFKVIWRRY